MEQRNWYSSWFDTPYYHILYQHRDENEACQLMQNLVQFLKLPKASHILDLACGRGRHAVYLNKLGFEVTGIDLSKNNISFAKQFENKNLHFKVQDMREPLDQQFDAVFNLFTSFGYFENPEKDNLETIRSIKKELKPNALGVIDFLNVEHVAKNLVPVDVKSKEGIDFHIKRRIEGNFIYKQIDFTDKGVDFSFTEEVDALRLEDFQYFFDEAGLVLREVFGDYELNAFEAESSPRLILVFQRQ